MNQQTPKQILIVGPAWVGDMVMAQTLFKLLKIENPACEIDVLAPTFTRPLLARMPEVRTAIPLAIGHGKLDLKKRWQMGQQLRKQGYDQAILLPNSLKSALVPFFAGIPVRTGWMGEYRFGLLNDVRYLNKEKLPLMIQRFQALGLPKDAPIPEGLPNPSFSILKDSIERTLAHFNLHTDKPILALCPGAEYGPAKRWPTHHFATVAAEKIKAGWQVWIFGAGQKDAPLGDEIQAATNQSCLNLINKTSLEQAIDLLSLANFVVSNDSGLMHISAALNRPLAVLYGSSSPKFTPPLSERVKILSLNLKCSPCFERVCPLKHLDCLEKLPPSMVLAAMDEMVPA